MISNPGPGLTRMQILQKAGSNFMKFSVDDWSALYLSETNNNHGPIDDLSAQKLQMTFANFRKRSQKSIKNVNER